MAYVGEDEKLTPNELFEQWLKENNFSYGILVIPPNGNGQLGIENALDATFCDYKITLGFVDNDQMQDKVNDK